MKKNISLILLLSYFFSYGQKATLDSLYPPSDLMISYHTEFTKNNYPKKIKEFKKDPLNFGDIVFLGNSITQQGKNWAERFNVSTVKNRGIAGDVTEGVIKRLPEIYYFKPKAVFILIGINDLFARKSPEFIVENILKIVEGIHENSKSTKIYVQTVLPTKNDFLVEKISAVNAGLKKMKSSHFKIIDLHELFRDENDLMKKEYTTDGTHLNEEGYKVWVNKVKKQVVSISKKKK